MTCGLPAVERGVAIWHRRGSGTIEIGSVNAAATVFDLARRRLVMNGGDESAAAFESSLLPCFGCTELDALSSL